MNVEGRIERIEITLDDQEKVLGAANQAVVKLRREVGMLREAVRELAQGEQPDLALALAEHTNESRSPVSGSPDP